MTTVVVASVTLENGTQWTNSWDTPVAFHRCLSKGARWAREEMRKERIKGRSAIKSLTVRVTRTCRPWTE